MEFTTKKRVFLFIEVFVVCVICGFVAQYFRYSFIISDMNFYSIILVPLPPSIGIAFSDKIFKKK